MPFSNMYCFATNGSQLNGTLLLDLFYVINWVYLIIIIELIEEGVGLGLPVLIMVRFSSNCRRLNGFFNKSAIISILFLSLMKH